MMKCTVVLTLLSTASAAVSANLLSQRGASGQALDKEACLSCLRGMFDMMQRVRHPELGALLENADGTDSICISELSPPTQLKLVVERHSDHNGSATPNQRAGVYLVEPFRKLYPCDS